MQFPTDPRSAIAQLPYLLARPPHDVLLVAGFDSSGALRHRCGFALDGPRPLDEPLLESSLWLEDVTFAAVVAYSATDAVNLCPLVDAWGYRGRTTLAAVWAGPTSWRSYACAEPCCAGGGLAYDSSTSTHPWADPLEHARPSMPAWRRARWQDWRNAITAVEAGAAPVPEDLCALVDSLHDIPLRDALLAHSADPVDPVRPALTELLTAAAHFAVVGTAVPLHTCLAAMHYLDGDLEHAGRLVSQVLAAEEYSLARLLQNGLDMRAPGSLLARSFAHFTPQELLAA